MYLVENKVGAIACMLLSLFFLGTWPAIFTFLERRGRLPQHTYLDYSITNLLAAVFIAFTLGEIGKGTTDSPNFLDQLSQDNWPSVLFALAGGVLLSLGNLATQYALALVSLSVTLVITCSTTVVIGTTINYFLDNKINNAEILFPGVGCFFIAVCLASAVHASNADDTKMKLDQSGLGNIDAKTSSFSALKGVHQNDGRTLIHYAVTELSIKLIPFPENSNFGSSSLPALTLGFFTEDMENASGLSEKVEVGTADSLIELEYRRAIKVLGRNTLSGLGIAFFGGVCFALFSPAFNLATNDQWHTLKEGVPHLTVYTAFFYFSISCFIVAAVLNVSFLYHPILNLPRSSFKTYSSDWNGRGWALLAGLLCGFGNGLQFMGGEAAGYAAADAVQALPLVSTFWGILLFGEYRRSSRRTYVLLVSMLFMFVVAVALLIASAGQRSVSATA